MQVTVAPDDRSGPADAGTVTPYGECRGRPAVLTPREFDLLLFLAPHPGQAFSTRDLLRRVWGWDFGDDSTVDGARA